MGGNPDEPPFFFMKPANALLPEGRIFPIPHRSENVHYEFELVVAIGSGQHRQHAGALDHHVSAASIRGLTDLLDGLFASGKR